MLIRVQQGERPLAHLARQHDAPPVLVGLGKLAEAARLHAQRLRFPLNAIIHCPPS